MLKIIQKIPIVIDSGIKSFDSNKYKTGIERNKNIAITNITTPKALYCLNFLSNFTTDKEPLYFED